MVLQVDARYPYQAGPWTCVHAVPGAHDAAHTAEEEPHMYHTSRRTGSPAVRLDSQARPAHVGASSLLDANVYDASGKRLATIDEIILDAGP